MEREIEHAFGGLDLANGDNGDDEDDDKIEDGRIDLAAGGDEGIFTYICMYILLYRFIHVNKRINFLYR
jgi:hypothetical protein